jgi:hypothetical protein
MKLTAVRARRGSGIRYFGGKRYLMYNTYDRKPEANAEAKRVRKEERRPARVVRDELGWTVYVGR